MRQKKKRTSVYVESPVARPSLSLNYLSDGDKSVCFRNRRIKFRVLLLSVVRTYGAQLKFATFLGLMCTGVYRQQKSLQSIITFIPLYL